MSAARPSEVHDFRGILSNPVEGRLPLLVGGHAVNLWALIYRERIGKNLDRWLPLTSKDLDLFGSITLLDDMKKRFGGVCRLSGPRSPVIGRLAVTINGKELEIDVLRDVVGLRRKDLEEDYDTVEVMAVDGAYSVRVLSVLAMLQAKAANLATLDQTDRNDFKHVHIMLLVAWEYLAMMIQTVEAEQVSSRAVIDRLEHVLEIVGSREAATCVNRYDIDLAAIWPRDLLLAARDQRLRNFVKHRLPS